MIVNELGFQMRQVEYCVSVIVIHDAGSLFGL